MGKTSCPHPIPKNLEVSLFPPPDALPSVLPDPLPSHSECPVFSSSRETSQINLPDSHPNASWRPLGDHLLGLLAMFP